MFILDTSALRAISKIQLEVLSKKYRIGISPVTFYELISHLDESKKNKTFEQQKGQVLKCTNVEVLPDPFAFHAVPRGIFRGINPSHFDEVRLVPDMLKALQASNSLEEFYKASIAFKDGVVGSLEQAARRIRDGLAEEEQEYLAHLGTLRGIIKNNFSPDRLHTFGDVELHALVVSALNASVQFEKQPEEAVSDALSAAVFCALYIHYGYKVSRTVLAMQNELKGGQFSPDPNDLEDGYIALYLRLFQDDCLVTGDQGTISAVHNTLNGLRANLPDPTLDLGARVIRPSELSASL